MKTGKIGNTSIDVIYKHNQSHPNDGLYTRKPIMNHPIPVLFELLDLKYYTIFFLLQHKKLKVKIYFFEIASNIDRPLRSTTAQFLEPAYAYLPFPQIQHTTKKP